MDNSYGKLSSFIGTWTSQCVLTDFASSLDEAIRFWRLKQEAGFVPERHRPGCA